MKTETISYYSIKQDSASSLKTFAEDRRKYYKKFVIGEKVEEKYNQAIMIGNIVDCILLEPDTIDDRFYMSTCSSVPTELMLKFVESLYECSIHMEGANFEQMSRAAYELSGYKISYEQVINKFAGSNAETYYNEIKAVRGKNLTVVTVEDMTNAERIIDELKTNFVTSHIINLESDDRFDVLNQFQIMDYEVDGHLFKSMMDKVIIDKVDRTIQVFDLKCTWSVENFYVEYYLYRKTYIQVFLYFTAWCKIVSDIHSPYFDFRVLPPKLIVCDSINYMNPLIYELTMEDLKEAYLGFEYKGRKYPGVREIIKDLDFAINNDMWNISRKNYESKGVVHIKG
jgi:hypothetical protein